MIPGGPLYFKADQVLVKSKPLSYKSCIQFLYAGPSPILWKTFQVNSNIQVPPSTGVLYFKLQAWLFFYFSLERLRRPNSKDTVCLCRLPAQTWLKWLGWQKTIQWENCCLMNQISLAKGLIPEWVQCGWEEGRGDPFSVSELLDGLNCLVQHPPLPENSYSWVSKSLLEASLPKWRIHDHILLYTCSLQAWVSAFFSNSKWRLWNYLLKSHKLELLWGKGNGVLNPPGSPQVVFYLVLCKQNVMVFIIKFPLAIIWDSYSIQIIIVMVIELDFI